MTIMQLKLPSEVSLEMKFAEIEPFYNKTVYETMALHENKNHDYYEAWREMRVSSMMEIILMKILSVKQIEDNEEKTIIPESIKANYQDMINFAVFCFIKLNFSS